MSEAELWELYLLRESLVLEYLVFLTSAASAYLLVAYYIGAKLSRFPTYIISAFFVFTSFICIHNIHWKNVGMREIQQKLGHANEFNQLVYVEHSLSIGLMIGGMFACLWYMWSVRRPKTE
jgi:phosphatidylserine synthase